LGVCSTSSPDQTAYTLALEHTTTIFCRYNNRTFRDVIHFLNAHICHHRPSFKYLPLLALVIENSLPDLLALPSFMQNLRLLVRQSQMDLYEAVEDDVSIPTTDNEDSEDIISDVGEDYNSLRPGRKSLGLARDYVPDWTSREAFREFCQNWFVTPFMTDRFTIADIVLQSGLTLLPKHSM
jgi:hypothetical protein